MNVKSDTHAWVGSRGIKRPLQEIGGHRRVVVRVRGVPELPGRLRFHGVRINFATVLTQRGRARGRRLGVDHVDCRSGP